MDTIKPRYKEPTLEKAYRDLLARAAVNDKSLEFKDGFNDAFWAGYNGGMKPLWIVPNTLLSVAYAAGKEHRRTHNRSR